MKKVLKITLIIILTMTILLVITPFIFKGKIEKIAKQQLAENLQANASFTKASISLFRNFPNLGVRIEGLCIVGLDQFAGDTLLYAEKIDIAVNLFSAIKMDNIDIKRIEIERPNIHAIVLEDGSANWDIFADDEAEEEIEEETHWNIVLKHFSLTDAMIRYSDHESDMFGALSNFNISMKGDLSEENTLLEFISTAHKFSFSYDNFPYLTDVRMDYNGKLQANLKNWIFTFKENKLKLNDADFELRGSIIMPEDDITMDLSFHSVDATFKKFLSLVPSLYKHEFASMTADGLVKLNGSVVGVISDSTNSDFDASVLIRNGSFSYPGLPKKASDININLDFHYDGSYYDSTSLDINQFHLNLGDNLIDAVLSLRNPESDPFFSGQIKADIDLMTLQDVVPLDENTSISGTIKGDIDWTGKYSFIEKEEYESFDAEGSVIIKNLAYQSPEIPKDFYLSSAELYFSPSQINVADFDAEIGTSDISLSGRVTNYIPYLLREEVIEAELKLKSKKINLNELLAEDEGDEEDAQEEASTAIEVVELPKNIDFRFTSSINSLLYGKMNLDNVRGDILLRDGSLIMENLSMNGLNGSLAVSGEYNTQNMKSPWMDIKLNASRIDIIQAVETFEVLGKISPIARKASGKVSFGINFNSLLQADMKPVMESISAGGHLASNKIGIKGSDIYRQIGNELKTDALDDMILKDIDLDFKIKDGTLHVQPFDAKLGKANLNIGGSHTFSNHIDYLIEMNTPTSLLGAENPTLNSLYRKAAAQGIELDRPETVEIMIKVEGDLKQPSIRLDLKEMAGSTMERLVDEAKEEGMEIIEEKADEVKEDAKAMAHEKADKIMREAEQKAELVRKEAKKAADEIRDEAKKNADKMVASAKNPVEKRAKQLAADKLIKEAENKAQKLEGEADMKAKGIMSEAKEKSDKLLE